MANTQQRRHTHQLRKGLQLGLKAPQGAKFVPMSGDAEIFGVRDYPGKKYPVRRRGYLVPLDRRVPLGMRRRLVLDGGMVRAVKASGQVDYDLGQRVYETRDVLDAKPRRPETVRVRVDGGEVRVDLSPEWADIYVGPRLQARIPRDAYVTGAVKIPVIGRTVRSHEELFWNPQRVPVYRPVYSSDSGGRDFLSQARRADQLDVNDPERIVFELLESRLDEPAPDYLPVLAGRCGVGPRLFWAAAKFDQVAELVEEPSPAFRRRFLQEAADTCLGIFPQTSGMVYESRKTRDPDIRQLVAPDGSTLMLTIEDEAGEPVATADLEEFLETDRPLRRFLSEPFTGASFEALREQLTEEEDYEAASISWLLSFCDVDANGDLLVPHWATTPKFRRRAVLDVRRLEKVEPEVQARLEASGFLEPGQTFRLYPRGYCPDNGDWGFGGVDFSDFMSPVVSPEAAEESQMKTDKTVLV